MEWGRWGVEKIGEMRVWGEGGKERKVGKIKEMEVV
jgi:hypothetical protein